MRLYSVQWTVHEDQGSHYKERIFNDVKQAKKFAEKVEGIMYILIVEVKRKTRYQDSF